ncbi:MAG: hypothetical protein Q9167_004345 [Letrouitia subvulpina]
MTTYVTRSPLTLITNPHMMSEPRRSSRRLSARPADKEDAPILNGAPQGNERAKPGKEDTGSEKHGKAGVNGANSSEAKGKVKRKLDYDEDSDGFRFTRARAKRVRAEPAPQIQPIEEVNHEETPKPAPPKRTRKRASGSPVVQPSGDGEKAERRRRSPRNSGDKAALENPPALEVKKKRRAKGGGASDDRNKKKKDKDDVAQPHGQPLENVPTLHSSIQTAEISQDPIKVSLPFADTPIIRRNKEMRKGAETGSRRSSLSLRGRRASSLIDSGKSDGEDTFRFEETSIADEHTALPHDEVETSEFYKHIETGLTEPRRMRQLLTWCGARALGEKPSSSAEDFHARQAARAIQQQLLKDFSAKSDMSDWFNRKDTTPPPQPPKPNPKNVANEKKIKELEQQIARLTTERETWESLLRPSSREPPLSPPQPAPTASSISPNILSSPAQISALKTLQSFSTGTTDDQTSGSSSDLLRSTSSRVQRATQNLEFEIDKFASNVHAIGSYQESTERVADEILSIGARALEEREKEGRRRGGADGEEGEGQEVGIRDVLRSLSRVIDR